MVKKVANDKDDSLTPEQKSELFQAALQVWELSSQQIYSRFNAMLTANSIFIAAIILTITGNLVPCIPLVLSILGIGICIVWYCFIRTGRSEELIDRINAYNLEEKRFGDNLLVEFRKYRCSFGNLAKATIILFLVAHLTLAGYSLYHLCCA